MFRSERNKNPGVPPCSILTTDTDYKWDSRAEPHLSWSTFRRFSLLSDTTLNPQTGEVNTDDLVTLILWTLMISFRGMGYIRQGVNSQSSMLMCWKKEKLMRNRIWGPNCDASEHGHDLEMAPRCTMGWKRGGGGHLMFWAMFWKLVYVDVILWDTTTFSWISHYKHCSGAVWGTWQRAQSASKFSRSLSGQALLGLTCLIHGGPSAHLWGVVWILWAVFMGHLQNIEQVVLVLWLRL